MSKPRLLTLVVLALLVVATAVWLSSQRSMRRDDTAGAGARVVPALSSALNDVSEVKLVKAGEQTAVTLKRAETNWQVAERAGYPADSSKVRKLLIDLSELKALEQKTANAANYAVLGVEDVKAADASGVRVELSGLKEPVSLIVGKNAGNRSSYARLATSEQSLAVTPAITVETDPRSWLDRSLLDIAADRVQQVRVTDAKRRSYTALRESRAQTDFTVRDLPKGRSLSSPAAANAASSALAGLTFDDVRAAGADEPASAESVRAEYRLFDGTIVAIAGRKEGERHWISLKTRFDEAQHQMFATPAATEAKEAAAPADEAKEDTAAVPPPPTQRKPDEVRAESDKLAARFSGWTYEIPAYKYDSLFRPLEELLKTP